MAKKSSPWFWLIFVMLPMPLWPQNSTNLKLIAQLNPAAGTTFSEVTGAGDLAIIGGFQTNSFVWIYDISQKPKPVLLSAIPVTSAVLDVQVHGRYLFVAFTNGMDWYDILDPANPKLINQFRPTPQVNAHTFFVAGNTLYIADQVSGGIRIFDVTDKRNPRSLTDILDPAWRIHDMTIIRDRLYGAWISGQAGLLLSDVSNPTTPHELAKVRYPQAGTHSAWPTEDERFILTGDEVGGTRHNLKIWDARTPGQLNLVAEFTPPAVDPNTSVIHNVYVRGRYAYISYYCAGVRIVDMIDPARPQQVAFYDLNGNTPCSSFNSNWGIYPYSKLIYASDIQNGLYVLEFTEHPPSNLTGQVVDAGTNAPIAGAVVYFRDEYPSTRTNAAGEFDIPWFKDDTVALVTEALGYRPDTTNVTTRSAAPTSLTIRLIGVPNLKIASTQIDDDQLGGSFGNGNGLIDAAETYELNLFFQNTGFAGLISGSVKLQSDDPYVTLVETQQTLGSISAGATGALDGALRFSVSPLAPVGHQLLFKLEANLNSQATQEIDFSLGMQPPEISNFRANTSANSVTLLWSPANDALLNGYHLYRKPTGQPDAQFTKLTPQPLTDTTFTLTGLATRELLTFAITKVVDNLESITGARLSIVVREGNAQLLVVNGVEWETYAEEMTNMYAALPFNAGQIFDTWDVISGGQGFPPGYFVISQVNMLSFEELRRYEVVVWVGNNFGGDLEAWYASLPAIKQYLDGGGRLVLITRLLYTFLQDNDFVSNYLHLAGAQILTQGPVVQQLVPLRNDLTAINAFGSNNLSPGLQSLPQNGLVEPIFYLYNDRNTIMGIRVRQRIDGSFNIAVIAGRPYRYDAVALGQNISVIINNWFGLGTAVNEPATPPLDFALLPAYPNPFTAVSNASAATQIIFQLAHREKVQLEIFNLLGQRVRELLNDSREAGQHVMVWNGTDEAGRRAAAGVYVLRIQAGECGGREENNPVAIKICAKNNAEEVRLREGQSTRF